MGAIPLSTPAIISADIATVATTPQPNPFQNLCPSIIPSRSGLNRPPPAAST